MLLAPCNMRKLLTFKAALENSEKKYIYLFQYQRSLNLIMQACSVQIN